MRGGDEWRHATIRLKPLNPAFRRFRSAMSDSILARGIRCYAWQVSIDETPRTQITGNGDTKAIIRSIVGTGIGLATLLLMLAGLMIQQNAATNSRIDDVNARIDDVNTNVNARIDDIHARIDDIQQDIRDLRALIIDAIKRPEPAD